DSAIGVRRNYSGRQNWRLIHVGSRTLLCDAVDRFFRARCLLPSDRRCDHQARVCVRAQNQIETVSSRAPLAIFLIALAVYVTVAGGRMLTQSVDHHFVAEAHAWLTGRLDLDQWPQGADNPAVVTRVALDDGRVVRGRKLLTRDAFRIVGGEE